MTYLLAPLNALAVWQCFPPNTMRVHVCFCQNLKEHLKIDVVMNEDKCSHVLDSGPDPPVEGAILGVGMLAVGIPLFSKTMWPFIKLL